MIGAKGLILVEEDVKMAAKKPICMHVRLNVSIDDLFDFMLKQSQKGQLKLNAEAGE